MPERRIATIDAKPGMQVKYDGVWWQIIQLVHNGYTGRCFGVRVRRVGNNGHVTNGAPLIIWLPVTAQGVPVRPGSPGSTTVRNHRRTVRVSLRPRHVHDQQPYLDSDGKRWGRTQTASARLIDGLADAFESGLTA
jgi:hypothetical protein